MKKIFFLSAIVSCAILLPQKSFSQAQHKVDSLLGVLKTAKEDTNKVNTLIALGRNGWQAGNYEDAKKYAFEAMKLSRKINFKKGEAIAYTISGTADMYTGDYAESLKNQSIALKISEEIGFKTGIGNAYNNIGLVYMLQGKYSEAEKYYNLALKVRIEIGDKAKVAATYNNLGILYDDQGKYVAALESYYAYLEVMRETGDKQGIADATMNIGLIYNHQGKNEEALKFFFDALKIFLEIDYKIGIGNSNHNIGIVYLDMANLALALHYELLSLKTFEEIGNKSGIGINHLSIGNVYTDMGRFDDALKEFFTAFKIFQEIGNSDKEAILNNAIGLCYFRQNELDNAINYYNKGILLAKEIGADNTLREGYRQLSETYKKKNDIKNAYKYHMLFTQINDSIFNETKNRQIEEMKAKYETEKKDAEISLLHKDKELQNSEIKKQKLLKFSFIGGLALVSVLTFFVYKNVRSQQKLKLQTLRNKIAIDLHDEVGSTLSSIALFSDVAKEQSKEVMPMLQNISDSSRKMLESMADIVWTINPENDNFEKIILRMRSFAYELLGAKKIDFDFKADDAVTQLKLSMEARKNLYLIFKEALNNMVKYSDANRASFSITGSKNNLTMLIRDNGKGFDIEKITQGNGLKNMKKRADEIGGKFLIESKTGNGTTIQLILKAA